MKPVAKRSPIHPQFAQARLEVHHAAQVVASASRLIPAEADYSHTNLFLDGSRLTTRALPNGQQPSLDIQTFELQLGEARFDLAGRTAKEGFDWLGAQVGGEVGPFEHDLPTRPDDPFTVTDAHDQVLAWIALGKELLQVARAEQKGGEVRLWPHHFDMATLAMLDAGDDQGEDENARSINIGLSLGDSSIDEPYWYVTPWPTPQSDLGNLVIGRWHTEGFTAAVLPASESGHDAATARAFLATATSACRKLLSQPNNGA